MCAGPGHPRDRRPAFATGTATIVCRSVAGWQCRLNAGEWRSTCDVARTISPVSISRPSSVTSCATCAARSICFGIAARFIAGAKSATSWPLILSSICITSPLTRLNSIPPGTSGLRQTIASPMERPTICASSALDSPIRPAACVAPKISCVPASMRRSFHGPDRAFHYLRRNARDRRSRNDRVTSLTSPEAAGSQDQFRQSSFR